MHHLVSFVYCAPVVLFFYAFFLILYLYLWYQ